MNVTLLDNHKPRVKRRGTNRDGPATGKYSTEYMYTLWCTIVSRESILAGEEGLQILFWGLLYLGFPMGLWYLA